MLLCSIYHSILLQFFFWLLLFTLPFHLFLYILRLFLISSSWIFYFHFWALFTFHFHIFLINHSSNTLFSENYLRGYYMNRLVLFFQIRILYFKFLLYFLGILCSQLNYTFGDWSFFLDSKILFSFLSLPSGHSPEHSFIPIFTSSP